MIEISRWKITKGKRSFFLVIFLYVHCLFHRNSYLSHLLEERKKELKSKLELIGILKFWKIKMKKKNAKSVKIWNKKRNTFKILNYILALIVSTKMRRRRRKENNNYKTPYDWCKNHDIDHFYATGWLNHAPYQLKFRHRFVLVYCAKRTKRKINYTNSCENKIVHSLRNTKYRQLKNALNSCKQTSFMCKSRVTQQKQRIKYFSIISTTNNRLTNRVDIRGNSKNCHFDICTRPLSFPWTKTIGVPVFLSSCFEFKKNTHKTNVFIGSFSFYF